MYAFGLHYFIIPNQLMEGGVTGIAILLNYAFGLAFIDLNLGAEYPFIYRRLADIRTNTDRLFDIRYNLVVRFSCFHGEAYPYRVDRPFSNFKRLHIGRIIRGSNVRLRAWDCVPIWRHYRGVLISLRGSHPK